MNRIALKFAELKKKQEGGLIPFLTAGFPTQESSAQLLKAFVRGGADFLEIGVPFSDPLADGPTIQEASQVSLANGTTVSSCLKLVRDLRQDKVGIPIILMGYCNPFLSFGIEQLADSAKDAGVDGFIIPDLPPVEANTWVTAFRKRNLDLIFFIAPNTKEERIKAITKNGSGFIYGITVTGVTGARTELPENFATAAQLARKHSTLPIAMGFGISTPQHVQQVIQKADAAIIASAIITRIKETPIDQRESKIENFIRELKAATKPRK